MGLVIVEGEGAVLGVNVGFPIEANGTFCVAVHLCESDALFQNYFGRTYSTWSGHCPVLEFQRCVRVASVYF